MAQGDSLLAQLSGGHRIALAVSLVFSKHAVIDTAVVPFITSSTMSLIKAIFAFVIVTIGERGASKAVPSSVTPFTIIGTLVFLIHHATGTVRPV